MCLSLAAESEKMNKQGLRGVVMKPVKCWLLQGCHNKKISFFFKISQHMVNYAKQEQEK